LLVQVTSAETETAHILADRLLDAVVGAIDSALSEADDDLQASELAKDYVQGRVQDRFMNSVKRLLARYARGGMSKSELVVEIQKRFRRDGISAFLAGKRSVGQFGLTAADRAALDNEFARDFARMEAVPSTVWARRLRLYAAKLRGLSQLGRLRAYLDARMDTDTLAWWALGDAEHCGDCEYLADSAPFRASDLIAQNLFPGSGHTECGNNCKCSLTFEEPLQKANPVSTSGMKGYRIRDEGIGGLWWLG
jgi:hypothetical protein